MSAKNVATRIKNVVGPVHPANRARSDRNSCRSKMRNGTFLFFGSIAATSKAKSSSSSSIWRWIASRRLLSVISFLLIMNLSSWRWKNLSIRWRQYSCPSFSESESTFAAAAASGGRSRLPPPRLLATTATGGFVGGTAAGRLTGWTGAGGFAGRRPRFPPRSFSIIATGGAIFGGYPFWETGGRN